MIKKSLHGSARCRRSVEAPEAAVAVADVVVAVDPVSVVGITERTTKVRTVEAEDTEIRVARMVVVEAGDMETRTEEVVVVAVTRRMAISVAVPGKRTVGTSDS